MLAASYPFAEVMWTLLVFFAFVVWVSLLFTVWFDVFRRDDISGLGKAGWLVLTILLPFVGVFAYVVAESDGMASRRSGGGPWKWA
jgi:hypothetical protein